MPETLDQSRADTAGLTFTVAGADDTELKVVGFEGREGISRLFGFDVELASEDAQIELAKMVGRACTLAIAGDQGTRYVQGIVRSFRRGGRGAHQVHYRAQIVPRVWLLTRRYGSRIFQTHNCPDMTVPGIVRKVLLDAGIPDDRFRFVLHREYQPREYVVQYRETDMDFISRLLEEEGIFYFFEHTAEEHVLVLGDSTAAHTPTPITSEAPYSEPTGLVSRREHIFEFAEQRELGYGAVRLDDFNFTKPPMELDVTAGGQDYQSLLWDETPGEYEDKALGQTYANLRLEEYAWRKHTIECAATARGLIAGYTFKMTDHPTPEANREYLAINVEHHGRQPQSGEDEGAATDGLHYEARLITIPAEVPFRPTRCTRCPKIQGAQTAIVVGPKDEEIYTDKYGRVKVQFHWDKE
ncbi:MAG: type VI secretion system tip protein VgrG, partial [Planctomycetota bacterium]